MNLSGFGSLAIDLEPNGRAVGKRCPNDGETYELKYEKQVEQA